MRRTPLVIQEAKKPRGKAQVFLMKEFLGEERDYHHVRVNDPDKFDRIRTVTFGKGIKARVGFGGGAEGSSDVVSILFPKDDYSMSQAKKWAKKNSYKIVKTAKAEGLSEARKAGKTEHSGSKKGRGAYYGRKKDAKKDSNKARRRAGKRAAREESVMKRTPLILRRLYESKEDRLMKLYAKYHPSDRGWQIYKGRGYPQGGGRSRSGWWVKFATGKTKWLGKTASDAEKSIMEGLLAEHGDDLSWTVPPRDQGQIVQVAYAVDPYDGLIYMRVLDKSDRSVEYYKAPLDKMRGEFEPWNEEPRVPDRAWKKMNRAPKL